MCVAENVVAIAAPEYVIVFKLLYTDMGGGDRHLRGIRRMLDRERVPIDRDEIVEDAGRMGVLPEWRRASAWSEPVQDVPQRQREETEPVGERRKLRPVEQMMTAHAAGDREPRGSFLCVPAACRGAEPLWAPGAGAICRRPPPTAGFLHFAMRMALNGIVFDLDGTLLDSNALHADAWVEGLAACGYRFTADRIGPEIGKGGDQLLAALLGEQVEEQHGDGIREAVSAAFRRLAASRRLRVFDGAEALLTAVRERGLLVALATAAAEEDLELMLENAGVDLRKMVDAVVTKSDVQASKPHPDIVRAAAGKLGLSPAQCAMVGDTPYDAIAARRAGAVTLGVCTSGLADVATLSRRLTQAGARKVWPDVATMLADVSGLLHSASPSRLQLSVHEQERLMRVALEAARDGMAHGEAPIGCVLFDGDGKEIARAYNEMQGTQNKTAHAEIVAFARAAGRVPLAASDLLLVSSLEPCVMCTGAAMESAVDTILFALHAPADSGSGRVTPPESPESAMPRIVGDILAAESRALFTEWLKGDVNEAQARYGRQLLASV